MVHFRGLTAIRGIAALTVLFSHLLQLGHRYFQLPSPGSEIISKAESAGGYAVTVFFTLSGFLITYLLLSEKDKMNAVNIRKFYVRRILRIWPLYYLYLIIAVLFLFAFGVSFVKTDLIFYFFLLGNVPLILHDGTPLIGHYWSLGVEEQFYLFWPFVISFFNKKLFAFMIAALAAVICIKWITFNFHTSGSARNYFTEALKIMRFDSMITGGLLAFLYFKNYKFSFLNIIWKYCIWITFFLVSFDIFFSSWVSHLVISVLICFIIAGQLNKAADDGQSENRVLMFLGKISYGVYVFHPLFIFLVSKLVKHYDFPVWSRYCLAYFGVSSLTIIAAYLSYKFFEERFLRMKIKYSIIYSR